MPLEAKVVYNIPDDIAAIVGRVMVTHSVIEHSLISISGYVLQLNRAEMRIAVKTPRPAESLEMALDLLAVKDIHLKTDTAKLRTDIEAACLKRDILAHSVWLEHPSSDALFLRLTRGQWPKAPLRGRVIKRAIFPESIPADLEYCKAALTACEKVLAGIELLGVEVDAVRQAFPEKFATPIPLLNPRGIRIQKAKLPKSPRQLKS